MVQLGAVIGHRVPGSGRLEVCRNWILWRSRTAVALAGLPAAQGVGYQAGDVVWWVHPLR